MKAFVVEVYWPDMTAALVEELVVRIDHAARKSPGVVRYVGCTMTPSDETCFIRLAATEQAAVRALVEQLELEGARVSELVDVAGTRLRPTSRRNPKRTPNG